jgi:hypothetical protein
LAQVIQGVCDLHKVSGKKYFREKKINHAEYERREDRTDKPKQEKQRAVV